MKSIWNKAGVLIWTLCLFILLIDYAFRDIDPTNFEAMIMILLAMRYYADDSRNNGGN